MRASLIVLLLLMAPASAETLMEKTGVNTAIGRAPSAADVVTAMHQFDLFVSGAGDTVDLRGTDALRNDATDRGKRAEVRDKQVSALAGKLGIKLGENPDVSRTNELAGLQGKVGADFISAYRTALTGEYTWVTATLRRYLYKPDSDAVKAFAAKQLPALTAELNQTSKIAPPGGGAK
jgi:putative membrane protein